MLFSLPHDHLARPPWLGRYVTTYEKAAGILTIIAGVILASNISRKATSSPVVQLPRPTVLCGARDRCRQNAFRLIYGRVVVTCLRVPEAICRLVDCLAPRSKPVVDMATSTVESKTTAAGRLLNIDAASSAAAKSAPCTSSPLHRTDCRGWATRTKHLSDCDRRCGLRRSKCAGRRPARDPAALVRSTDRVDRPTPYVRPLMSLSDRGGCCGTCHQTHARRSPPTVAAAPRRVRPDRHRRTRG
jgi:hypothetical protein